MINSLKLNCFNLIYLADKELEKDRLSHKMAFGHIPNQRIVNINNPVEKECQRQMPEEKSISNVHEERFEECEFSTIIPMNFFCVIFANSGFKQII